MYVANTVNNEIFKKKRNFHDFCRFLIIHKFSLLILMHKSCFCSILAKPQSLAQHCNPSIDDYTGIKQIISIQFHFVDCIQFPGHLEAHFCVVRRFNGNCTCCLLFLTWKLFKVTYSTWI